MKLTPPFPLTTIAQRFGDNANPLYKGQGLKGHSGIDFGVPYGSAIPSATDSLCYSVMNKDNPNLMFYRAVFTIIDDVDFSYEVSYGHCSDITAVPDTKCLQGAVLGHTGNTGDVYAGNHAVTLEEKQAGSHAGTHLHFQVRKLKKESVNIPMGNLKYINDGQKQLVLNGFRYFVVDYENGYNGCIDPMPFFALELTPSEKLTNLANGMMAANPKQAKILLAVAGLLKAFTSL